MIKEDNNPKDWIQRLGGKLILLENLASTIRSVESTDSFKIRVHHIWKLITNQYSSELI